MKVKAAIAFEKAKPLIVDYVDLEGPKKGEVLVEIKSTGVCHTDAYTLSGDDPEGIFPSILGHEGAGIVVEVGDGVTSLKKDDHVIPLYTPECRKCKFCLSGKTNLCQAIRETQGKGLMPDGTSRFSFNNKTIYHYMGTSTFSNYTVVPEIALAKVRKDAPPNKICYIGCGVTTGIGAVLNTAKMEEGSTAVIFGFGGFGGDKGFMSWLDTSKINIVIDATHPFAFKITERTQRLCIEKKIPYMFILRNEWVPKEIVNCTSVKTYREAFSKISPGSRVFLATGRQSLDEFSLLIMFK